MAENTAKSLGVSPLSYLATRLGVMSKCFLANTIFSQFLAGKKFPSEETVTVV
jgi:hypothetical protein